MIQRLLDGMIMMLMRLCFSSACSDPVDCVIASEWGNIKATIMVLLRVKK